MRWLIPLALVGALVGACAGASPKQTSSAVEETIAASADPSGTLTAVRCNGPDTDWSPYPAIVRLWGGAWMASDDVARRKILEEVWAVDGYYVDPFVEAPVVGREALAAHMDYAMAPGQYVEVSAWTDEDEHHDRLRIRWRHCCPTGVALIEGTDVGEIDSGRRLARVTSFWNNEVELPSDVACG
jgi:hypothetical protein